MAMAIRLEDLPPIVIASSRWCSHSTLRMIGCGRHRYLQGHGVGSRSEKFSAVVTDQLALDLADLATDVTLPAAANDDHLPSKPVGAIGALPRHLPRCEQVIEPETTACPCCQGRLHRIGQDLSE